MEVHAKLSKNSDLIISGFEKAGIKDFVNPWLSMHIMIVILCMCTSICLIR